MADSDGILGMGIMVELRDAFSANAQRMQNGMRGISTHADMMGGALRNLQSAFGGLLAGASIMAPFALAVNKAREFEQQLSNIKSLGVLPAQMKQVEMLAMEMGAKTKFSALESAQGIEELLKAGVDLKQIMDKNGLSGALDLAVAGNLKLASAAEIASTALNAFRKDAMTIRDAGNILAGAANASATDVETLRLSLAAVSAVAAGVGLSFKDTNIALALFANNGLKGSDAGTSLKTMLMNLQPRTKEQIATFQRLGFMTAQGANAFFDAAGKLRPMNDIAGLLNTNLKHLTDQQRSFALETMFGSDAIRAGNILFKEGAEGVAKMQQEMLKVTAAQVAREKLNNFNGALEMLMGTIDTILIRVGQIFLPTLTRLVQAVGVVADAFLGFVNTPLGTYFVVAAAAITSFIFVFGSVVPFVRTLISTVRLLGVVAWQTAASFAPYLALAGVVFVAYQAFSSFKTLLEGTEKPATGLWGALQRVGMAMWTIGQVVSTWNGKTFDLGGNEARLQALGMLDTVKALSTYIVRFIELAKGIGSGIYSVFAGVASIIGSVIGYVMQGLRSFLQYFGMQNAMLKYSSSQVQTWANVGKILGYVIGTLLVGAAISLTVSLASMAVAVIAATWPILAIIAAIGAVVAVFYYWDDITAWVSNNFHKAMKWMGDGLVWLWTKMKEGAAFALQAVGNFLMNLPTYFWEALKFSWGIVVEFYTKFLPYTLGLLAGWGWSIIQHIPGFFASAFQLAVQAAQWAITKGIPLLLNTISTWGARLIEQIPSLFGQAFSWGLQAAWWAITEGVPMLAQILSNFNLWLGNAIIAGFSFAFNTAMEWGYWAISEGLPNLMGAIGEFLWWVLETVPALIGQAFSDAFAWVLGKAGEFFTQAGTFFWEGGKTLINSLWEGMQAIWQQVEAWLQQTVSYATLGFVEGAQKSGTGNDAVRPNPAARIGEQMAEIGAIKAQNTINQTTNIEGGGGNIFLNIDLGEGETVQKVVDKQQATKNSRR